MTETNIPAGGKRYTWQIGGADVIFVEDRIRPMTGQRMATIAWTSFSASAPHVGIEFAQMLAEAAALCDRLQTEIDAAKVEKPSGNLKLRLAPNQPRTYTTGR